MKIEAGTMIGGRYRVERELGRGGMGAVYVAFDTRFDKQVAVKVTHAGGGAHDVLMARFKREAKISNELGSESGFVRAFDWGEVPPAGLFLAMDLVEDASPLDLTSGSLEERLLRLKAAAELVQRAHEQGIVHRDIKPANVLQDGAGGIHLTDFGIAKVLDGPNAGNDAMPGGLTQSGIGMGTPHYMSPEQCADAKAVDARCDVFALGVMLFRALTGKLPFPGSSLTEIMRKHIAVEAGTQSAPRPSEHWAEIPVQLDELCARAIHVDPEQRLSSVAELIAGLEDPIGGAPTVEVPTPEAASAPTAITPPPPAPDESDLSTGALSSEPTTLPPAAHAQTQASGATPGWLKFLGLALIVGSSLGVYQLFKGTSLEPAQPPISGTTQSTFKPKAPGIGLSKGAPVVHVRRRDLACYVGQVTGIALKVDASGPVTIEGESSEGQTLHEADVASGKEVTFEEVIEGKVGTLSWTYTALDAKGRRSLPVSVEIEVKPPALSVRRLDATSSGGASSRLEFRVEAGDEVKVVDAASGDGLFPIRPGETQVLEEVLRGEIGLQSWRYYVEDAAGNRSEAVAVEYTVEAPKLNARRLDDAHFVGDAAELEFTTPGPDEITVLDENGDSWHLRPGTPLVLPRTVAGEVGSHAWRYWVADADGKRSGDPVVIDYTVAAPELKVRRLDAESRTEALARLEFNSPSGGLQVVGGGLHFALEPRPMSALVTLPASPGPYTLSFVAIDNDGNRSQPVELTIEVQGEGEAAPVQRMPGYAALIERAKQVPGLRHLSAREFSSGGQAYRIARFLHEPTRLTFHLLPGGSYRAGGKPGHVGKREDELVPHTVEVAPLLVAATECTQAAWRLIMPSLPPYSRDPTAPVFNVTWQEAGAFCRRAGVRLPTELEWEYACRGGTSSAYCFGDEKKTLLDYAEFELNNEGAAKPVAGKLANAYGLHDMHGNVWEWCQDTYVSKRKPGPKVVLEDSLYRVMRGGSFNSTAAWCRSAHRGLSKPAERAANIGFRPVISLP